MRTRIALKSCVALIFGFTQKNPSRPTIHFILLIVWATLAASHAFCQVPENPPIPEGLGVNIHFTQPQPGELQMIKDAGFRWVRIDVNWFWTERKPGVYDFSAYDGLIQALDQQRLRAMLILCYSNPFYDHGLSPYTDAGQGAFMRWAVAAIHHFRGHGILWEIYNEPNYARFWRPEVNVQDYIRLALRVGEAVVENDPGEMMVGPASALIDLPFLAACFQAGLLNYWSAVTVHPYRQRDPETVWAEYYAVRWLIAKYAPAGKKIPIIPSEWGYSSRWKWDGMNQQMQARLLAREFLTDIDDGIPLTFWYDWPNDDGDPNNTEGHFGLVNTVKSPHGPIRLQPKLSYYAAKALYDALDGFTFERRLPVGQKEDYVLVFRKGDQTRLTAWTIAAKPHAIEIQGAKGKFTVEDMLGKKLKPLRAHGRRLTLTVSDDPVYLVPLNRQGLSASPPARERSDQTSPN
ncbi:MAG: beta-1,4-xylanase [Terriglobia bacterium]